MNKSVIVLKIYLCAFGAFQQTTHFLEAKFHKMRSNLFAAAN